MKITVFGSGYVGLTTGACLANLGHNVLCVDIDAEKIKTIQQGQVPFFEPGIKELIQRNRDKKRLSFSTDLREGVNFGEVIFNCVGTPGQDDGSADLSYVFNVAENVGRFSSGKKLLINKSTVPPGTSRKCDALIKKVSPTAEIEVVSNPEFLAEGKAVYDFNHPDKIVIGAKSDWAFSMLRKIYLGRVRTYIPILETNWETAELIKYANNSFLATKISFINEIANISDKVGADVKVIAQAMGMDYRISPKFLHAGIGYGGSCFPKDVRALVHTAKEHNYNSQLLHQVDALNERQKRSIMGKVNMAFNNDLAGRSFCLFGLSFKPRTSDIRDAPSIHVINELLSSGAKIQVYDPEAMEEIRNIYGDKISYCSSPEDAARNTSGILLLTEWDEFRNLDLSALRQTMADNKLFDGRNIYEPQNVREEGFEYYGMGRK
jgi:UDPglucose 6-dehydrogenase